MIRRTTVKFDALYIYIFVLLGNLELQLLINGGHIQYIQHLITNKIFSAYMISHKTCIDAIVDKFFFWHIILSSCRIMHAGN